jgi:predicted nuclease of predicted toxin-antitoxin system
VKPPEPFTWFVDRSLGRRIIDSLRAAGFQVEAHADHFVDDAPDVVWLGEAGRRGWVVLTKDKAVRRNELEFQAIMTSEVACFSLGHGNLKSEQMAEAFVTARPGMEKALRRYNMLIATVTATGHVQVLSADGALLTKARSVK